MKQGTENNEKRITNSKPIPAHPATVQGSDSGRARGEAAGEAAEGSTKKETTLKPCECGCGEYPKNPSSRFLPGHSLKSHYKDHPEQDQHYEEMKDREKFGEK